MPEPKSLNLQNGSALAGVLGLTTVMMIAASGYMLVVANTTQNESAQVEEIRRSYAAESGYLLAGRYLTRHDSSTLSTQPVGTIQLLSDWNSLDGYMAKVELQLVATQPLFFNIESWASLGPGFDTALVRGSARILNDAGAPNNDSCTVILSGWQDTIRNSK